MTWGIVKNINNGGSIQLLFATTRYYFWLRETFINVPIISDFFSAIFCNTVKIAFILT